MTITKADILKKLSENFGLEKEESKYFVELFFEEIRCILQEGCCSLKFSGFGNFNLKNKNDRPGRNPKTGEGVMITARRVVTFHAGPKLRRSIQKGNQKAAYLKSQLLIK